jgi:glucokinase
VNSTYAIGVDLGGTKCAAGLVQLDSGEVVSQRVTPTLPLRGGRAVLDDVASLIDEFRREAEARRCAVEGVGIGIAELVSGDGRLLSAATIDWTNLDPAGAIAGRTGLPVRIDADVRAAARAEAVHGAGRDLGDFLYVTVGTGISAALVVEGVPYAGSRGLTGTFASATTLIPGLDGSLLAGQPLEQFASGPALASRYAAASHAFQGDARNVLALCQSGDALAEAVATSGGEALGAAIGALVNMLDPEAVVLGGGLGVAEGVYREAVVRSLRQHIWSEVHRDLPLVSATLGEAAGLVGAALAVVGPTGR